MPAPAVNLTPAELAERLHVSEGQLANWRCAKPPRGPAYIRGESTGRKALVLYPLAEVEAWEQRRLIRPGGREPQPA